jgi:hypothetical protein
LGFGEAAAELELDDTVGDEGAGGFRVGNVNVGKISEDVDEDADSDGTSGGVFDVDEKELLYGGTYESEVGMGETVPEPLVFDLNLGGFRYVVLGLGLEPNS